MNADAEMEGIFSGGFCHVLVAGDAGGFESFAGDVFFLPGDEMDAEGELIDAFLLHSHVIDAYFG
ncbi:hypothetical protein T12_8889, partial [Trichinella patagoniensis]